MNLLLLLLLFFLYLIPSFTFDLYFDFWKGYFPYYYEAAYVVIALIIFKKEIILRVQDSKALSYGMVRYFLGGVLAVVFARLFSTKMPFDLTDKTTMVFLLLIGPVIEELIFRFSLWKIIERVTKSQKAAFYVTAILFSLAHFKAVLVISVPYLTFVTFQSLYTFLLAVNLGSRYMKNKNILEMIVLHIVFNFGFWAGSFYVY